MPKRKANVRDRITLWTLGQSLDLWCDRQNESALRDAWRERGPALMERWIELHPGTRPLGWWCFEAEEPRRFLYQSEHYQPKDWLLSNYRICPDSPESGHETEADYLAKYELGIGDAIPRFRSLESAYHVRRWRTTPAYIREWLTRRRQETGCDWLGSGSRFTTRTGAAACRED